ncbi:MAG TPA: TonB-dependent receptor plug domain-containing protein, partial [Polyangiaceae bacterium]|nr:TonB-dependent receptor plug domain-containing protein [Polyangiaceae bacterium]
MKMRHVCAGGVSLGCALWMSSGWAQAPAPAPEAPADEAPAPPPQPAPEAPPAPPAEGAGEGEAAGQGEAAGAAEQALDVAPGEEPLPEDVPEDASPAAMDEVVVTVDRRKKDLQDYSGTAAAFSQTQLSSVGINTVSQLSQVVPGLQIGVNDQGSATVYIRGVGSDNTTELGDPAVAVHIDGVYLPRVRGLNAAYLDV